MAGYILENRQKQYRHRLVHLPHQPAPCLRQVGIHNQVACEGDRMGCPYSSLAKTCQAAGNLQAVIDLTRQRFLKLPLLNFLKHGDVTRFKVEVG